MNEFPETGKIDDEFFKERVYPFCGYSRPEVVAPPQFGVDVSLVNLPNGYEMALTSDPLTLLPGMGLKESAWLSVQLMANDMVTTGQAPMYAQFVLNLPPHFSAGDFQTYWKHIHRFCADMGTAITGGHTGRFEGQHSTVAGGGTMITIAPQGTLLTSKEARAGDSIIVTKESALLASSVLALSFPETVSHKCGSETQEKAAALFYETSSLQEGLTASRLNDQNGKIVTAMHDVTEGGVLGAIYEMALASQCGVIVDTGRLPTGKAQQKICDLFAIDPHFCVGAGSMIMAVKDGQETIVIKALEDKGVRATAVGKFTEKKEGSHLISNGTIKELTHPGTDPYWEAFYRAVNSGLR